MKKIIIIITIITLISSCSLDGLNNDTKNPSKVSGESLFVNAQKSLVNQMRTPDVNYNNTNLWSQYWQQTTYTDESNYDQVTRLIPDRHFNTLNYVLKNLDESKKVIEAVKYDQSDEQKIKENKLAVTEILTLYTYSILVETFGNIPYTESLDIENITTPKYDDGLTVYKDLIKRVTEVIKKIDVSKGSFGESDRIYKGDMKKWKKFAASLKLRMGILLSDVDNSFAKKAVEEAFTSGVFTSNQDNAEYNYFADAPNTNPVHNSLVLSGRDDYVAAKTIVDKMNELKDPRIAFYFKPTDDGTYKGGYIGENSTFKKYSHVSDAVQAAKAKGNILDYAEVQFLLAEAAARGFSVGGQPEKYYKAGIIASFEYWGSTKEKAQTYMQQPGVNYTTALANSKASSSWKEVIGTQKWLALYNRGFESWTSIRLLDYPKMTTPSRAVSGFPNRYTYPVSEQTINKANWQTASNAIGGDKPETKLFWDKN